jgi:hypothetical protein
MTVAHLYRVIQDAAGNVVPGAQVSLCDPGSTSALITDLVYADQQLTAVMPNPFTVPHGVINVYLARPRTITLKTLVGSVASYIDYVDVLPAAENILATTTPIVIGNDAFAGGVLQMQDLNTAVWSDTVGSGGGLNTPMPQAASPTLNAVTGEASWNGLDVEGNPMPLGFDFAKVESILAQPYDVATLDVSATPDGAFNPTTHGFLVSTGDTFTVTSHKLGHDTQLNDLDHTLDNIVGVVYVDTTSTEWQSMTVVGPDYRAGVVAYFFAQDLALVSNGGLSGAAAIEVAILGVPDSDEGILAVVQSDDKGGFVGQPGTFFLSTSPIADGFKIQARIFTGTQRLEVIITTLADEVVLVASQKVVFDEGASLLGSLAGLVLGQVSNSPNKQMITGLTIGYGAYDDLFSDLFELLMGGALPAGELLILEVARVAGAGQLPAAIPYGYVQIAAVNQAGMAGPPSPAFVSLPISVRPSMPQAAAPTIDYLTGAGSWNGLDVSGNPMPLGFAYAKVESTLPLPIDVATLDVSATPDGAFNPTTHGFLVGTGDTFAVTGHKLGFNVGADTLGMVYADTTSSSYQTMTVSRPDYAAGILVYLFAQDLAGVGNEGFADSITVAFVGSTGSLGIVGVGRSTDTSIAGDDAGLFYISMNPISDGFKIYARYDNYYNLFEMILTTVTDEAILIISQQLLVGNALPSPGTYAGFALGQTQAASAAGVQTVAGLTIGHSDPVGFALGDSTNSFRLEIGRIAGAGPLPQPIPHGEIRVTAVDEAGIPGYPSTPTPSTPSMSTPAIIVPQADPSMQSGGPNQLITDGTYLYLWSGTKWTRFNPDPTYT